MNNLYFNFLQLDLKIHDSHRNSNSFTKSYSLDYRQCETIIPAFDVIQLDFIKVIKKYIIFI